MLAGDIYEPKKIRLIDVEEHSLSQGNGSGEIIFQPELGCLCGSDLLFFEADYPEFPVVVGHSLHELIGTVVETNGDRFQPGDRVLCVPVNQEGLFERFRVSDERAIAVDPRRPVDEALMAQPLGTVLYALKKVPNVIDWNVAVVGQGPIGQLFCAALRNLGARRIIAIDPLASRLETSPRMGATEIVDSSQVDPVEAVKEITGGSMADLVIEAVGHREQALNLCIDLSRQEGRILYFGVTSKVIDGVRWYDLMCKNITVHTSINPSFEEDFPLAMQWISEGRIDVSPIITHRFALADIQAAFDMFFQRREGALKILIDFPAGG